jgi:diguanylate cyclase (GGDEF)-like protein/PAS domain S-box-containing protein
VNKQGNAIKKFASSPLTRISFGLVMLTASVMFISDLLGLVPDTKDSELRVRKAVTEMLAVQITTNIQNNLLGGISKAVDSVVERNDNVLSGAVRLASGELLAQSGQHQELWDLAPTDKSTPSQIQVSLFNGGQRWGSLELRFSDMGYGSSGLSMGSPFIYLVLFISIVGFIGYRLFLNRALRELNPDAVIPERVRKALDTLSEGLIIVDKEGVIIFSNMAFARKTGFLSEKLVGKNSGSLDWAVNLLKGDADSLPWMQVMAGEPVPQGQRLNLTTALKENFVFNVNVSPITASEDEIKGALVTFDDVTELEAKNESLREAMGRLEESQQEILIQNEELVRLATRDPLTNALNRRALFEIFDTVFAEAVEEEGELCCLMVDIDHFKLVNDTYGHGVGDEAIKFMCDTLTQYSRPNDLVGRLGGEEFVVVLPSADVPLATAIGEKMRKALEAGDKDNYPDVPKLTASFGLVSIHDEAVDAKELLNQSDEALYVAKETGRNRLIRWSQSMQKDEPQQGGVAEDAVVNGESVAEPIGASNEEAYGSSADNDLVLNSQLRKDLAPAKEKVSRDPVQCSPEKALLLERINQAIARVKQYESKVALMVVDIEALQRVSDTLGTLPTEKFAKTIIARIKEAIQKVEMPCQNEEGEPSLIVSRFNGNEFAVLLPDLDKSALVTSFVYSIFSISSEPVVAESNQFYLNANIGLSVYPSHGNSADELLKNASSAMHEAKQKHDKNNFQFYSKEIGERAKQKIQLEAELYRAIENSELAIHYQPRVDLSNGQVLGLEALVRWHHPQLGMVPPDDFIPLAEQTGLIRDISKWLVQTASLQIKAWREMGFESASVSINLSPVEFRDPDLADQIITIVREVGIPPDALEFEITESVVMYSVDATAKILEQLHHAGFGLSLDDFGTGYSSLSYLKSFPVSKVKIDRSFIENLGADHNDAAIVSGIISMAHSMDLRVVAEGVEKEEQLRYLQDLQCDEVQGYLLGGALSVDKATNLLDDPSSVQRMVVDDRNDHLTMLDAGENKIAI